MFRRRFVWCLALVFLSSNIVFACADQGSEKGQLKVKSKSEMIAAEYGLTVEEDITPSEFKVRDLELVSFLKTEDGGFVNGQIMRQRAITLKANLGLVDAKRLLDNQSEIPSEFRSKALVFTGTLLRGSGGSLRVACLFWDDGCWRLDFCWFGFDFGGYDRLVRCKSSAL